jgi:hypothetical protein
MLAFSCVSGLFTFIFGVWQSITYSPPIYWPPHQYTTTNRISQMTSTKCQYQMANSTPRWSHGPSPPAIKRPRVTARVVAPTRTWVPWNPVATKKIAPKHLSLIENLACAYSVAWRAVKYTPRRTVQKTHLSALRPPTRRWWATVTVAPLLRRTAVFSSGRWKGLIALKCAGGQVFPTSTAGDRAKWKKDQKKAPKKQSSLKRNHSIPNCSPSTAKGDSSPLDPSRLTSAHQSPPVRPQIAREARAPILPPNWNQTTVLEAKRPPKKYTTTNRNIKKT